MIKEYLLLLCIINTVFPMAGPSREDISFRESIEAVISHGNHEQKLEKLNLITNFILNLSKLKKYIDDYTTARLEIRSYVDKGLSNYEGYALAEYDVRDIFKNGDRFLNIGSTPEAINIYLKTSSILRDSKDRYKRNSSLKPFKTDLEKINSLLDVTDDYLLKKALFIAKGQILCSYRDKIFNIKSCKYLNNINFLNTRYRDLFSQKLINYFNSINSSIVEYLKKSVEDIKKYGGGDTFTQSDFEFDEILHSLSLDTDFVIQELREKYNISYETLEKVVKSSKRNKVANYKYLKRLIINPEDDISYIQGTVNLTEKRLPGKIFPELDIVYDKVEEKAFHKKDYSRKKSKKKSKVKLKKDRKPVVTYFSEEESVPAASEYPAIDYHERVIRWFTDPYIPFERDSKYANVRSQYTQNKIIAHHNFSSIIDIYIDNFAQTSIKFGTETLVIPAKFEYYSGESEIGLISYSFAINSDGSRGICYHRSFGIKSYNDFMDEILANGKFNIEFPPLSAFNSKRSSGDGEQIIYNLPDSSDGSEIISENDDYIVINDPKNNLKITLFNGNFDS